MFELELPQDIQNRISATERRLWAELDTQKLKEESKKVQEWILDRGHTMGRTNLYEKSVALFWVMRELVGRDEWDRLTNDSGSPSPDPWKAAISASIQDVEASIQRVEDKVDFLIACLGFQLPSPSNLDAAKLDFPGSTETNAKDLSYILL